MYIQLILIRLAGFFGVCLKRERLDGALYGSIKLTFGCQADIKLCYLRQLFADKPANIEPFVRTLVQNDLNGQSPHGRWLLQYCLHIQQHHSIMVNNYSFYSHYFWKSHVFFLYLFILNLDTNSNTMFKQLNYPVVLWIICLFFSQWTLRSQVRWYYQSCIIITIVILQALCKYMVMTISERPQSHKSWRAYLRDVLRNMKNELPMPELCRCLTAAAAELYKQGHVKALHVSCLRYSLLQPWKLKGHTNLSKFHRTKGRKVQTVFIFIMLPPCRLLNVDVWIYILREIYLRY